MVQGYLRYGFNDFTTPGMEVLLGPNYQNLGLQASFTSKMGSLNFNTLFSHFDPATTDRVFRTNEKPVVHLKLRNIEQCEVRLYKIDLRPL